MHIRVDILAVNEKERDISVYIRMDILALTRDVFRFKLVYGGGTD